MDTDEMSAQVSAEPLRRPAAVILGELAKAEREPHPASIMAELTTAELARRTGMPESDVENACLALAAAGVLGGEGALDGWYLNALDVFSGPRSPALEDVFEAALRQELREQRKAPARRGAVRGLNRGR